MLGLIYPGFETRGEILRLVAERDALRAWPRDPDGTPLYPGVAKSLPPDDRERRMARGPYALRLDTGAAMLRTGPLAGCETGTGDEGDAGAPRAVGRRGARPQGHADKLPFIGRGG